MTHMSVCSINNTLTRIWLLSATLWSYHIWSGNHINLETISPLLLNKPEYISPQIIQEILKTCGVDLEKFKCYKHCKARHQTVRV